MNQKNNDRLIENTAKVVINKMENPQMSLCQRVLGGHSNVARAANVGLSNGDLFGLITAHLILNYCLGEEGAPERSTLEVKAFKEGVAAFPKFLAQCALEIEAQRIAQQQQEPN